MNSIPNGHDHDDEERENETNDDIDQNESTDKEERKVKIKEIDPGKLIKEYTDKDDLEDGDKDNEED